MRIRPLRLKGTFEVTLDPMRDERGYFARSYDRAIFEKAGLQTEWVQENQSESVNRYTIRGLHFQRPPYAETKLVRAVVGAILDVCVDLRAGSATFGQWDAIELSDVNHKAMYVPAGFAHGFCSLTDRVVVTYKVDAPYEPSAEGRLVWNDAQVCIRWPTDSPIMSEKDRAAPGLASVPPIHLKHGT